MKNISKPIFLNALACPTYGWLMRNEGLTRPATLGDKLRMEEGLEIGRRARELFSDGILIDNKNMEMAVNETKKLIMDPNISTIFEASFFVNNFATKADILKKDGDGWHMLEVKSSLNDKKEFIEDMAYTSMVIQLAGYELTKVSLILLSRDYRLGMDNKDLFIEIDHTEDVLELVEKFKEYSDEVDKVTRLPNRPEPTLRFECKGCSLFYEKCIGNGTENHIFDLPRLSKSKFDSLIESGICCIEDIPNNFKLTSNQQIINKCVSCKDIYIGEGLGNELSRISWPAFYLDFETVQTALPLYSKIAPYTQIPTQYSIHVCSEQGKEIKHMEYLADPSKDCRRKLAENLINDLEGNGSIIVYSSFEKTVMNKLKAEFPDLSDSLDSLIERLYDLEAVIRKKFYHPGFHGSTSIKKTLPVLVPEMTYEGMEIPDGTTAVAYFAYMAMGKYDDDEVRRIRANLLEYCKQDTLAMVKLHEKLMEFAVNDSNQR